MRNGINLQLSNRQAQVWMINSFHQTQNPLGRPIFLLHCTSLGGILCLPPFGAFLASAVHLFRPHRLASALRLVNVRIFPRSIPYLLLNIWCLCRKSTHIRASTSQSERGRLLLVEVCVADVQPMPHGCRPELQTCPALWVGAGVTYPCASVVRRIIAVV